MEYIGRRVRKEEQAAFSGLVKAFEPETGVFRIVYDDGDLVEVGLSELHKLLEPPLEVAREVEACAVEVEVKCGVESGRGGEGDCSMNAGGDSGDLVAEAGGSGVSCLKLNEGLDLNDDGLGGFNYGGDEVGGGRKLRPLDLNYGENVKINGVLVNDVFVEHRAEGEKDIIDLNFDVNEDEDLGGDRKRRRFDLNMELLENDVVNLDDGAGGDQQTRGEFSVEGGDIDHNVEQKEENMLKNWAPGVESETVAAPVSLPRRRGRKRKVDVNSNVEVASEMRLVDVGGGDVELEFESRDETPLKGCDESVRDVSVVSGSALRGRRGRKKTEALGSSATIMATPETGLRRSSRRAKSAVIFGHDNAAELDGNSHQLSSPTISAVSDKKVTGAGRFRAAECTVLPPKVELPLPSSSLNLDGVSPFDLLSVYAFLRSFSTVLFLSPFQIDEFVESVKCTDSTTLFDSVHVCLLRILRKHLQYLSNQGHVSATNCLRSLNWDFLDIITWPMYVAEYLFLHNPGYIPGLDIHQSKPFENCFYKLPVSVKVEILRHLCDDVVEAEVFRSEINRRMSGIDRDMDLEQNRKSDSSRKRKAVIDVTSTSCVTEDDIQEDADGNSDECCLCKMDGNLICCDGCPAAFHARCVGVVCSLLPEGDWYCPECLIEKDNPSLKMGKSSRGADLLGIDPYGRRFYSSCGYLLVSESCEEKYSYWSYNIHDIPIVVEALETTPFLYDEITSAICKHWSIIQGVGGTKNDMDSRSYSSHSAFPGIIEPQTMCVAGEYEKSVVASYSCNMDPKNAENVAAALGTSSLLKRENQVASSEGSAEVSQASTKIDNLKDSGSESLRVCPDIPDGANILADTENLKVIDIPLDVAQCKNLISVNNHGANYVNHYLFAYEASLLLEGLASKSSGKTSQYAPRPIEDIVAGQAKAISNRFSDFSWSNILKSSMNYKKEKCGWCIHCQVPEIEKDCLFLVKTSIPAVENFTTEALGIQLSQNRENHLINVMCHMICIEDHLQGLLLGPWSNGQHSILWRNSVAGAADIASLKHLLLMMESNLHHLVFHAEWRKHVDSVTTMGSASHIVRNYPRAPPNNGIERRTGNRAGLSLFWWRGGTVSRKLFNWKALPRLLASKAARQGGLEKIPGVLYPEIGDIAKRTKCDAWRATVESSRSVDQLALQIRELDAIIKWDEIWDANFSLKADKNSKKSVKSFKKVVIRKKSSAGPVARYLLDFGKRRTSYIPDVVLQRGTLLDDSSNDKRKYWLEEAFVPLHLMKVFEEKRIARKSNKPISSELHKISGTWGKPVEKKGFAYLFSKAESLETHLCSHCKKDVLVREAVSCEHCKGYFHKKHVCKAFGSAAGDCVYTCRKCRTVVEGKGNCGVRKSNNASKGLKRLRSGKGKKKQKGKHFVWLENKKPDPFVVPLRRSARYAERIVKVALQNTKVKNKKIVKKAKAAKGKSRKLDVGGWKGKNTRATTCSSYWLKGLQFSGRRDDERLLHFKRKKLLVLSGEASSRRKKPVCSLCGELEYAPELNYLACEACGVWFHGDALDLSADNIENLIGFKCYKCLDKRIPVCPHSYPAGSSKSKLVADCTLETECSEEDL